MQISDKATIIQLESAAIENVEEFTYYDSREDKKDATGKDVISR